MSSKQFVYLSIFIGSLIGGYIPVLFGNQSLFSISSLLGNTLGALVGLAIGYKLGMKYGS